MATYSIRNEKDRIIATLAPTVRLRASVLYTLGVAALVAEMALTYPHHRDSFARYPTTDFKDPKLSWWGWFIFSVLFLCALVIALVSTRHWVRIHQQELEFGADVLIYWHDPRWLFRSRRYDMKFIKWPRFADGHIEFDYPGGPVRIGVSLQKFEVQEILGALCHRFPDLAPIWSRCVNSTAESAPQTLTAPR
ncbi:MAG TPA: hypothetical protein VEJ38_13390 [Candidatus Acidoferrales bacterium]|nr:hypothetical protein [Candidatus Acidoferrales bacterium]